MRLGCRTPVPARVMMTSTILRGPVNPCLFWPASSVGDAESEPWENVQAFAIVTLCLVHGSVENMATTPGRTPHYLEARALSLVIRLRGGGLRKKASTSNADDQTLLKSMRMDESARTSPLARTAARQSPGEGEINSREKLLTPLFHTCWALKAPENSTTKSRRSRVEDCSYLLAVQNATSRGQVIS